jgi:hypothetical protein
MAENWQYRVKKALKEIVFRATTLRGFLTMFLGISRGLPSQVQTVAEAAIDALKHITEVADFISVEISKNEKEINWEAIRSVFPKREWLDSVEDALFYLDNNQQFRQFMSQYEGTLRGKFVDNIITKFQDIAIIFLDELDHHEENFVSYITNPPSLFNRISQILLEEFGEHRGFFDYWNGIAQQFNDAWGAADKNKLEDVRDQVRELFEIMPEGKKKAYEGYFNQFFDAIGNTSPLRKFRLIRHLLGK